MTKRIVTESYAGKYNKFVNPPLNEFEVIATELREAGINDIDGVKRDLQDLGIINKPKTEETNRRLPSLTDDEIFDISNKLSDESPFELKWLVERLSGERITCRQYNIICYSMSYKHFVLQGFKKLINIIVDPENLLIIKWPYINYDKALAIDIVNSYFPELKINDEKTALMDTKALMKLGVVSSKSKRNINPKVQIAIGFLTGFILAALLF
jgi:hypothetical protein